MKNEIHIKPTSGYIMLLVLFILIVGMIASIVLTDNPEFVLFIPILILIMRGFFIVNPNS